MRQTDTRERLLAAARATVREHGLASTSRDITAAAGVNLAAITYHFGSKDELLAAALFEELHRRLSPTLELLTSGGDPITTTVTAIEALTTDFEANRKDAPVYLEALLLASRPGPFANSARKLIRSVQKRLRLQIEALVADGFAPSWTDPEAMATLFIALANGVALQASIDPRRCSPRAVAVQLAGLLASAGQPSTPRQAPAAAT
ncbi:MAG: TetR/AcrR family transcriptional regulator [Actinobacteria bacterium]|nr:TetR/AcrR family transcriptional regulator [Actinomycetota bacterium]